MADGDTTTTTTTTSLVKFGMASFKNAVTGVHLQNIKEGEAASTAEAIDEDGNVEQIDVYAKKKTISGTGNVLTSGSIAVTVGGTLTVNSTTYKITSCEKDHNVNGHTTFTFSGEAPYSSSSSSGTGGSAT